MSIREQKEKARIQNPAAACLAESVWMRARIHAWASHGQTTMSWDSTVCACPQRRAGVCCDANAAAAAGHVSLIHRAATQGGRVSDCRCRPFLI